MPTAIIDDNNIAIVAGNITVFHFYETTREYCGSSVKYLLVGLGIPVHACADAPPVEKEGFAIIRNVTNSSWNYIEDHRGETVYEISTGNEVLIKNIGPYPDGTSTTKPEFTNTKKYNLKINKGNRRMLPGKQRFPGRILMSLLKIG